MPDVMLGFDAEGVQRVLDLLARQNNDLFAQAIRKGTYEPTAHELEWTIRAYKDADYTCQIDHAILKDRIVAVTERIFKREGKDKTAEIYAEATDDFITTHEERVEIYNRYVERKNAGKGPNDARLMPMELTEYNHFQPEYDRTLEAYALMEKATGVAVPRKPMRPSAGSPGDTKPGGGAEHPAVS